MTSDLALSTRNLQPLRIENLILKIEDTMEYKELRKTLQFSLYIQEEYEMAWERFFITSIPYDERPTTQVKTTLPTAPQIESIHHGSPTDYFNPQDNVPSEQEIEELLKQSKALEKEKVRNILQVED